MTGTQERLREVRREITQMMTRIDPGVSEILHQLVDLIGEVDSKVEQHKRGGIYDHPELKS